ncbi:hypothetical protein KL930_000690 [Ogataea haglerorum]|uniref:Regulator of free ubiquitin chains 1 n=1 Tax=Ogataea haglerorum TaxID=1937702 RepID=A0ABQ7RP61_9ASCO|nr:hypothetical protein KL915_000692 [Ogataea haglerorum]KAG7769363.1 hypothetical protein KL946_000646 [Ogataea haglerorum]KAG7781504.1 hypothetical protein KL922_000426 [Ogataea haglerorum]KAG7782228.1 hypothetical protein KL930_000690 [Ogataea haglerorum]
MVSSSAGDSALLQNPKLLNSVATSYEYSNAIPLKVWLRSASTMLRHARYYATDGNVSETYVLYLRFVDLLANRLYKHPELRGWKQQKDGAANYQMYQSLCKKMPEIMSEAERIRKILDERYARQQEEQQRVLRRRAAAAKPKPVSVTAPVTPEPHPELDASLATKLRSLSSSSANSSQAKLEISYPDEFAIESPKPEPSAQSEPTPAVLHKTVNFTEGGSPLRTVFLPPKVVDEFLVIAKRNTSKKLETCGILCGKLNRNAFFINYLVIPEQHSTPNTCNTKNEEKLFDFIDNLDLFVLGWIHTHPTQSCFLSSVDLHTQNSYQIMLNEAIAVVCSPRFERQVGIFRLTDPPGIPVITNCNQTGFHPHESENLYVECDRTSTKTGHVVLKDLPFQIKDLR